MMPDPLPPTDPARRVLDALQRAGRRARRVAAQTETRLVVVRDGRLVREPVRPESAPSANGGTSEGSGS